MQQLNTRSLELLEVKSTLSEHKKCDQQLLHQDRVLKLTLEKLAHSTRHSAALEQQIVSKENKHYVEVSRLRLQTIEAKESAKLANSLASKATLHLERLEKASPITQTIEAREPKSYGCGNPVKVSVVDQARIDGTSESALQVSNRDSAKLSKLHSSNEATAQLPSIP